MPRGGHRERAGRKSGWNHPETQTIRVPSVFANQLLEIARKLDNGEFLDFVSKSNSTHNDIDTKSYTQEDLDTAAQEVLSDLTVTRNGKDKGAVKKAFEALIKCLNQSLPTA